MVYNINHDSKPVLISSSIFRGPVQTWFFNQKSALVPVSVLDPEHVPSPAPSTPPDTCLKNYKGLITLVNSEFYLNSSKQIQSPSESQGRRQSSSLEFSGESRNLQPNSLIIFRVSIGVTGLILPTKINVIRCILTTVNDDSKCSVKNKTLCVRQSRIIQSESIFLKQEVHIIDLLVSSNSKNLVKKNSIANQPSKHSENSSNVPNSVMNIRKHVNDDSVHSELIFRDIKYQDSQVSPNLNPEIKLEKINETQLIDRFISSSINFEIYLNVVIFEIYLNIVITCNSGLRA